MVVEMVDAPLRVIEHPIGIVHETLRRREVNLRPEWPGIVCGLGNSHEDRQCKELETHCSTCWETRNIRLILVLKCQQRGGKGGYLYARQPYCWRQLDTVMLRRMTPLSPISCSDCYHSLVVVKWARQDIAQPDAAWPTLNSLCVPIRNTIQL